MKTRLICFIILIGFIVQSCNDDWLEPYPLSIYTPESVFIDKDGMDAVLLSLRRELREEFYLSKVTSGVPNKLSWDLMCTDIGVATEHRVIGVIDFDIGVLPTGVATEPSFPHWGLAWNAIRDANVVISRINTPDWRSEDEKNAILAEAYFHRAYWYYKLVNQFGDVPFLSQEVNSPKIDFYTHSRETILERIQQDLEFSVQWLYEEVEPGKINRAAGNHLLTKIYLATSQFDKAVASSTSVINGGVHHLMTERFGSVAGNSSYNVIWDLHQPENKSITTNKEGILVIQDKYGFPGASSVRGNSFLWLFTPWWSHAQYIKDPDGKRGCVDTNFDPQILKYGRGTAGFRPSSYSTHLIWDGAEGDLRHSNDINWMTIDKLYFNNPESNYFGQPVDVSYSNQEDSLRGWFPWPFYKLSFGITDQNDPARPRGGNSDWYLFRIAETYLLRAEAYFWKGDLDNSAADINRVRDRAQAPLISAGDITIEFILAERARELYLEEFRKVELTRIAFIMAENNLRGYSRSNFHEKNFYYDHVVSNNTFFNRNYYNSTGYIYKISPHHVLWPIPQDAIDANAGGRINQNLGYQGSEKNIPPKTNIDDD